MAVCQFGCSSGSTVRGRAGTLCFLSILAEMGLMRIGIICQGLNRMDHVGRGKKAFVCAQGYVQDACFGHSQ